MAASCVLVTNPSLSGPTLVPHSIDGSEGATAQLVVPIGLDFRWLLLWRELPDIVLPLLKFSSAHLPHADRRRRGGLPREWMHSDLPPASILLPMFPRP